MVCVVCQRNTTLLPNCRNRDLIVLMYKKKTHIKWLSSCQCLNFCLGSIGQPILLYVEHHCLENLLWYARKRKKMKRTLNINGTYFKSCSEKKQWARRNIFTHELPKMSQSQRHIYALVLCPHNYFLCFSFCWLWFPLSSHPPPFFHYCFFPFLSVHPSNRNLLRF